MSWHFKHSLSYSSTDNLLSPIPASDELIFCCGNLVLHKKERKEKRKKEMKIIKNKFFVEKNKKCQKCIYKQRVALFTLNLPNLLMM